MQAVFLVGGLGTRIKPKPMIEIGSKPILRHILKTYSHYAINDFAPEHVRCIAWNDPMIGIERPLTQHGIFSPQLSWRDLQGSSFNSETAGSW